ncbi:MAG: ATP-binding protein, partial [Kineosporiaceae bacterium]
MSILEITVAGEELPDTTAAAAFEVTPFAMSCYVDPALNDVAEEIEDDAREICRQLARLGATMREWAQPAPDRDKTQVEYRLQAWCKDDRPRNSALVWVGHGVSRATDAWLWVGGRPQPVGEACDLPLHASDLATLLRDQGARRHQWSASPGHWSLVLIQACGAIGVARRVDSLLTGASAIANEGLLIIACGNELGNAYPDDLPKALEAVIDSFTENTTSISVRSLANALEDRLRGIGKVYQHDLGAVRDIPRLVRLPDPVAAPWSAYRKLSRSLDRLDEADLQALALAGTGTRLGELALRFVGRAEELASIFRWLGTRSDGLLVVTGPEGVGKSALLGNVDVHSRPAVRSWLQGAGLLPPGPPPSPATPVDVSLALHGGGVQDLLAGLLTGLDLDLGQRPLRVDAVRDAIRDAVREGRREGPVTAVVDGLDHARERPELAEALRRLTTATPLRILAAARHWELPEPSPDEREQTLALRRDPRAIEMYVRYRLLEVTDPVHDEALRDRVAGLVAGDHSGAQRQFLYATIAVHEIVADPSVLADPPRLAHLLDGQDEDLFRTALQRMTDREPAVRPYLAALALAQGPGMPRADGIWTAAARALAPADVELELTEESLDAVLDVAAPYVVVDVQDQVAVYRLAHRALAAVLLPADGTATASARLAVVRALVALAARS